MNALYLKRQDDGKIEIAEFLAIVGDFPGVRNLMTENVFRASVEANYIYEEDQTIIRLDENQKIIAVTGIGKASVQAVFKIQKRDAHTLRSFDMDYSFDIIVTGVTSVEELRKKMNISR